MTLVGFVWIQIRDSFDGLTEDIAATIQRGQAEGYIQVGQCQTHAVRPIGERREGSTAGAVIQIQIDIEDLDFQTGRGSG